MTVLPPLESVRAFEAAARHESFVLAGRELDVTAATVSKRVPGTGEAHRHPVVLAPPPGRALERARPVVCG